MESASKKNLKQRFDYISLLLGIILLGYPFTGNSQEIDIIIKNGHVIDTKNGINSLMDVAISKGKIFKVAADIPSAGAKKVIDAKGLYVSPGLINIHTHVFAGSNPGFVDGTSSQLPDAFGPRSGITTVVDAGTSGWKNFPQFKSQVIDKSTTRVLAFLNIFESGLVSGSATEPDLSTFDVQQTADVVKKNPGVIVGTRIGHYSGKDWAPFDRAIEAAQISNVPFFVECHLPQYSLEDQLKKMRPGDIITHAYENVHERMTVIDENGKIRPFVRQAQQRGVLFDVGHGGAGFWFNQAVPALKEGLLPNSFGTDEHRTSMNSGMKTILNVMSKYLAMGMSIQEIIARGTWKPALSIKRPDLGNLSVGSEADVALLRIVKGEFGFVDSGNNRLDGDQKLEAEMTIRAGRIIWDLNGLGATKFSQ
ncbi:MAG: amidohydrolase/deacetylase family metallohydrolase [Bacteroidota bacterium]